MLTWQPCRMARLEAAWRFLSEGGTGDQLFYSILALFGAGIVGVALVGGSGSGTRATLVALGLTVFFASVALAGSARREARAAAGQTRVEAKLDELIQLEREQLVELRRVATLQERESRA